MKTRFFLLHGCAATLLLLPVAAWADRNPDFDDDAKPILSVQPGLIEDVEQRFDVKDTGEAKYPGNDDQRPGPPFIFQARPRGSDGPYFLRLLIQPGPPNHILRVVDMRKVHLTNPGVAAAPAPAPQPMPPAPAAPAPSAPAPTPAAQPQPQAPATAPQEPTADTPSGPITDSGAPATSTPSLEPPPDPAPPTK